MITQADNLRLGYVEFATRDVAAARNFYTTAFGWQFTDYGPDYTSFSDGRIAGGFFRSDKRASLDSGSALVVIQHPKLEETFDRVVDGGGRITRDIFSYPGGRRFHFTEPSGNELSVCADEGAAS